MNHLRSRSVYSTTTIAGEPVATTTTSTTAIKVEDQHQTHTKPQPIHDSMALDKTLESILRSECAHLGTQFTSRGGSTVVAQPSGRRLFAKIESSVEQTVGEAESLKAMGSALSGSDSRLTPEVHASGTSDDGRAYLITDYLDLKPSISKSGQKLLGQRLAEMHKRGVNRDGRFGFGVATYCGVTVSCCAPACGQAWPRKVQMESQD